MSKDLVSLHFEAEELFQQLRQNNMSIVDVILMIRLIEMISAAQKVMPEFDDRMSMYENALSKIYGSGYFTDNE